MSRDIPPGFIERWAIRLPNGQLARLGCSEVLFRDRREAEWLADNFRSGAESLGITDWSGEIVRQLCTPFLGDRDTAEHLIADLQRWLETQTAGGAA